MYNQMATTQVQTNEIKNALRRHYGALKEVCERAECSRQMVQMVLSGSRKSNRILSIAAEVALRREKEAAEESARIVNMAEQLGFFSGQAIAM